MKHCHQPNGQFVCTGDATETFSFGILNKQVCSRNIMLIRNILELVLVFYGAVNDVYAWLGWGYHNVAVIHIVL